MQTSELIERLTGFVARELLHGDDADLTEDTPLLEWGVLDSRSMVSILAFIEDEFSLAVPDDAVRPENFANIRSLATLLGELPQPDEQGSAHGGGSSSIRALTPMGVQEGEVDLGDGRVLHQLRSAGMPPPWVLLPAPGNTASIYGPLLRSMDGDQAAAAFDLLGFGHSLSFDKEPRFEHQVALVRDGLAQFSDVPCVLVGSGLSGWIAAEVARMVPERIAALVLVGTGKPADPTAWVERMRTMAEDPDAMVEQLHYRAPSLPERTHRSIRRALQKPALGLLLDSVAPAMQRGLEGIEAPTLLLAGDQDPLVTDREFAAAAASAAHVVVERIPRCGHLPHVERSQEMLMMVRQFLAPLGEVVGR